MKTIFIPPKYHAVVNDKDYKFLTAIGDWSYSNGRAVHWYHDESGGRHRIWMENVVMERKLGHMLPKGTTVEHISERRQGKEGRLNNTRKNLRLKTKKTVDPEIKRAIERMTGGCKGVIIKRGKFDVHVWYYGKRLEFGHFNTLHEALCVYGFVYRVLWNTYTPEVTIGEPSPALQKFLIRQMIKAGVDEAQLHLDE